MRRHLHTASALVALIALSLGVGVALVMLAALRVDRIEAYGLLAFAGLLLVATLGRVAWQSMRHAELALAELAGANAELERRIVRRTRQVGASNRRLMQINAKRKQLLEDKDHLIKDIHHRVKNNLQMMASLLRLQQGGAGPDAAALLTESLRRVHALGLIHEQLYRSETMTQVHFGQFVARLCEELRETYGLDRDVAIQTAVEDIAFELDSAIPLALILSEVVGNACRHAFPPGSRGWIRIALARADGWITLTVRDNGIGLPLGIAADRPAGLGLRLVGALSGQLGATHRFEPALGTAFHLAMPRAERLGEPERLALRA